LKGDVERLKLLKEIEKAEYSYFITIKTQMLSRISKILSFLNSRINIINDWRNQFLQTARKGYKQSDLDKGAERVFHNWAGLFISEPNSTPVGADLVFDTDNGFRVHTDIKTALTTNISDYRGVINIGKNQTSFSVPGKFKANLPTRYSDGNLTLTYAIQVVHEYFSERIHAILLACIPNGKLFKIYGDKIMKAGKGGWKKAKDFRFRYEFRNEILKFELIEGKPPRVEIVSGLKGSKIVDELKKLGLNISNYHEI
jgi:hypothetical protein